MKLRTFIDRPILACVISVLILMLGLISLFNLPMEQYPDIAPPTVMVSTSYTGANAETVQKSVIVLSTYRHPPPSCNRILCPSGDTKPAVNC